MQIQCRLSDFSPPKKAYRDQRKRLHPARYIETRSVYVVKRVFLATFEEHFLSLLIISILWPDVCAIYKEKA